MKDIDREEEENKGKHWSSIYLDLMLE